MSSIHPADKEFIEKITKLVHENLADEHFGVSELAGRIGMSRSNLLRKVKKLTKLSVSRFIRQERLKEALKMLRETSNNVTEVSYNVGFGSTSYFIKCFHEYYGFPPGEAAMREIAKEGKAKVENTGKRKVYLITASVVLILLLIISLVSIKSFSHSESEMGKSIAVLPFVNDSNDSTNVYIINGLMESLLNNLQKIDGLRVISRTSVEKYRDNPQVISKIAKELNVKYFVEGSGQKIDDRIFLNVQLIDASKDEHLWAEQYQRDTKDIFKLQMELAKSIAGQIEVVITPEAAAQIEKIPTENLLAYDYFLRGADLMRRAGPGDIDSSIFYFNKALELDDEFAFAYALNAISYFFLDLYRREKQHTELINYYADKALLFDPKLAQSLIAKATYFMNISDYLKAVPYLEKALEYNPNSILVINILSDLYARVIPNTNKYLEYALRSLQLEMPADDSVSASFAYLHIGNAFIQSGFVKEAEYYVEKSLEINPLNLYSEYVLAFVKYAKNKNLRQTRNMLLHTYGKDTTRWDVLQEVAKLYYFMRDYETAFKYYQKFIKIRNDQNMNVFWTEDAKIAFVMSKLEKEEESGTFIEEYRRMAGMDQSIYRNLNFAVYYSLTGEKEKAIQELKLFSQESNFNYWMVLFMDIDPVMDNIRNHPEYKMILKDIEKKFWVEHNQTKRKLEIQGLL